MSKKLSLIGLILMVFTSVFGFANIPTAFYLMSYSAIPWYIISALLFFVPYAFMMAEFGAAFRREQGGIYSWMARSVGPKFAFIGTFMWFSSYVIWMVSTSSKIWIPFSTAIFGNDQTQTWSFFNLNSTQTVGLLAITWIVVVTFFATMGLNKISKVTSIGGIAVMGLNLVLLIVSIIILFLNGGKLAQPISGIKTFMQSPHPDYTTPLALVSFAVFAIFAYGGIEAIGGLVDKTENAKHNFPKGILISAIVISIGYSLGIFLAGISTNWHAVLGAETTNLGNITYVLMKNLGLQFGKALGVTDATAVTMSIWFARLTGLSMFLAYTGAFFTLIYSPLKTIIQGTPKQLWPKKLVVLSKDGMPVYAMWIQCVIVAFIILLTSFGGEGASVFFKKLTLMTNVAMTLPILFLAFSFPKFKKNNKIEKPFIIFKTYQSGLIASIIVILLVGFANIFTIIHPAIDGDISSTLWMLGGPVVFSLTAWIIYSLSERRKIDGNEKEENGI
ncbi:MAG: glutamate/gamma-aminobutyrate family transporter YjeM [Bacillaceae bacterium]